MSKPDALPCPMCGELVKGKALSNWRLRVKYGTAKNGPFCSLRCYGDFKLAQGQAAREAKEQAAAMRERAAIVTWLRNNSWAPVELASMIEAGEHWTDTGEV